MDWAMFTDGVLAVSVFSACSTFVMPWSLRESALMMGMASALSAWVLLMREPVTTISCNWTSSVATFGAVCAVAAPASAARTAAESALLAYLMVIRENP